MLLALVYLVLGAMLDVFGMLALTIPFVAPVASERGCNRIRVSPSEVRAC